MHWETENLCDWLYCSGLVRTHAIFLRYASVRLILGRKGLSSLMVGCQLIKEAGTKSCITSGKPLVQKDEWTQEELYVSFVSLLTLCLDPPLWAAGHSRCLHQTGKGLPARNHLYCGAENAHHTRLLCWQEWASEWGIEEVTVPWSCLLLWVWKELWKWNLGLPLACPRPLAPFFPLTLGVLPLLLPFLCFPLPSFPSSLKLTSS